MLLQGNEELCIHIANVNNSSWSCRNSGTIWCMHRQYSPGSFLIYAKEKSQSTRLEEGLKKGVEGGAEKRKGRSSGRG